TLLESIQLLTVVGVPVCVWLGLGAERLVVLLFERGEFTQADAVLTGLLIRLMVPSVLLDRIVSITQTLFYANGDFRTPLVSTLIKPLGHTVFAILLVRAFAVAGLPTAVSLASLSNTIYMLRKVNIRFGPLGWSEIWDLPVRLGASCAVGAA